MKYLQKQQLLEQIIYATMWILILGTPLIGLLLDDEHPLEMSQIGKEITDTWLMVLPFFLLFIVHNYVLIPYLLLKKYYTRYVLSLRFVIGILFLYLPGCIQVFHPHPLFHQEQEFAVTDSMYEQIYPQVLPHTPPVVKEVPPVHPPFLLIHIIIAILLVGFNLTIRFFLKSLHDDEMLKELEHQHLESELKYLKYQLNPHFFMNTLNNIHALVDIDSEKAKKTIIELSKLMRYVLYEANKSQISLKYEIQFLENYIALMKLRYTEHLDIQTEFPLIVPHVQIPPLLFISLLENAFKHGVSYRESSYIHVRITLTDGLISFTCSNSKHTSSDDSHHGIGIDNIKKRLHLLFGNNYTFTIMEDNASYKVLLIIPPLS